MNDVHGIGGEVMIRRGKVLAGLIAALDACASGKPSARPLADIADDVFAAFGFASGDPAWAVAQALRALGNAIEWEPAVASADARPERFRDAARHLAGKAFEIERQGQWPATLEEALRCLVELDSIASVSHIVSLLQTTPIASLTSTLLEPRRPWTPRTSPEPARPTPTVLLRFTLDGQAATWPISLNPARAYLLEAQAETDAWPVDAAGMEIGFHTDVPASVIEVPSISIAPGRTSGTGYLVPKREIGWREPVTFEPTVRFAIQGGESIPANVVGQRMLRVSTFDPIVVGVGQPMVAQRIVELLGEMDGRIKNLPRPDRLNLIHLLQATARFRAIANDRKDLVGVDEAGFQAKLKAAYELDPFIGTRIQEAPKLAGGTTDLFLGRIVNELKVSPDPIDVDDADKFVRQPTQYASAGDCPISVLTVLDTSPKKDPEGVLANYMRWAVPRLHGAAEPTIPSMVAVVIIGVGFPVPSAFSKRPAGEVEHIEPAVVEPHVRPGIASRSDRDA